MNSDLKFEIFVDDHKFACKIRKFLMLHRIILWKEVLTLFLLGVGVKLTPCRFILLGVGVKTRPPVGLLHNSKVLEAVFLTFPKYKLNLCFDPLSVVRF